MTCKELTASLLSPKPILKYLSQYDEYVIFWNGIEMPYNLGLAIAMAAFGIRITPSMVLEIVQRHDKLVALGAYHTETMIQRPSTTVLYHIKTLMTHHIQTCTAGLSANQVLEWFDYTKKEFYANNI